MILDYRFHNDETHAHPGRFGREERVEQAGHDLRVDALARIAHRYVDAAGFVTARAQSESAWSVTIAYRVERVEDQVQDGLRQMGLVASNEW